MSRGGAWAETCAKRLTDFTDLLTNWAEAWTKRGSGVRGREIRGTGCRWMAQMAMWARWSVESRAASVEEVAEMRQAKLVRRPPGKRKADSDSDQWGTCDLPLMRTHGTDERAWTVGTVCSVRHRAVLFC